MKNTVLAVLFTLTASTSFAEIVCGKLTLSEPCDVDTCSVFLQVSEDESKPHFIGIGRLDGVNLYHDYQVQQLGLFEKLGEDFCVHGEVQNNQFIYEAASTLTSLSDL